MRSNKENQHGLLSVSRKKRARFLTPNCFRR
jgi:hypothetical protein